MVMKQNENPACESKHVPGKCKQQANAGPRAARAAARAHTAPGPARALRGVNGKTQRLSWTLGLTRVGSVLRTNCDRKHLLSRHC